MRAAEDHAKTVCGNLQLCAGLKAGIEGATHAVGQRRLKRVRTQRGEEEIAAEEVTKEPGDEGEEVVAGLNLGNLTIETKVTQEEAEEGLIAALEINMEGDRESEGEEGDGGTQRSMEAFKLLTQDAEPSGTTLVDARNGFNELSRLRML